MNKSEILFNYTIHFNQLKEIFKALNEDYPTDNELEYRVILALVQRHNCALEYDCIF